MINFNAAENHNERSYNFNRPRRTHKHKYTKYSMLQ